MDLSLLKDYGPWAILAAYLLWQSWHRELRMGRRLDRQADRLTELTERSVVAQEQSTAVLKTLVEVLRQRPCLVEEPTIQQASRKHRTPLPEVDTDILPAVGKQHGDAA